MENLKIIKEYKFIRGGSSIVLEIGNRVRVKTNRGIIEGALSSVNESCDAFVVDNGYTMNRITCDEVIDMI